MNKEKLKYEKLQQAIASLRSRRGCLANINNDNARELTNTMGCPDGSKEQKTLCLLALINKFFKGNPAVDFLFLGLNLLKGFEKIDSVEKRRRKYYEEYLSHENLSQSYITDTLRKREDNLINELARQILTANEKGTLAGIIKKAPDKLELPIPLHQKSLVIEDETTTTSKNFLSEKLKEMEQEDLVSDIEHLRSIRLTLKDVVNLFEQKRWSAFYPSSNICYIERAYNEIIPINFWHKDILDAIAELKSKYENFCFMIKLYTFEITLPFCPNEKFINVIVDDSDGERCSDKRVELFNILNCSYCELHSAFKKVSTLEKELKNCSKIK